MSIDYTKYKLNYPFLSGRTPLRKLALPHPHNNTIPTSFELTSEQCGQVYDQGQLGSCVSNSTAKCLEINLRINSNVNYEPSRLFIYYNGRAEAGYPINEDTGMCVYDGVLSVELYSAPPESSWVYDITQFSVKPSDQSYQLAQQYKLYKFYSIPQNLDALKQTLNLNLPISFGIVVYSSFMTQTASQTGIIPLPNKQTESVDGGHCCTIVGYNDTTQQFKFLNSWGSWGMNGYGFLPYQFVMDPTLSSDFYVISNFQAIRLNDNLGRHCFLKCLGK